MSKVVLLLMAFIFVSPSLYAGDDAPETEAAGTGVEEHRVARQDDRQERREDRQGNRKDRRKIRQGNRDERQEGRQENRQERKHRRDK